MEIRAARIARRGPVTKEAGATKSPPVDRPSVHQPVSEVDEQLHNEWVA